MFGPITCISKCFGTSRKLTRIRFLSCMTSKMCLLILEARVCFVATLKSTLVRFFSRVSSHVNNQHVLCFKRFPVSRTISPTTDVTFLVALDVIFFKMLDKKSLSLKLSEAVFPLTVRFIQSLPWFFFVVIVDVVVIVMTGAQDMITIIVGTEGCRR